MGMRHRAIRLLLTLVVLCLAAGAVHYGRILAQVHTYNGAIAAGDPERIDWQAPPSLLVVKAYQLAERGRLDEAIALYRRLEDQVPEEDLAPVLYNLGTTHFALAQRLHALPRANVAPVVQQARISFMRALRADSRLYEAKYNLEYLGLPRAESPGETEGAVDDVTDPEAGGTHRWQLLQDYPEGMP